MLTVWLIIFNIFFIQWQGAINKLIIWYIYIVYLLLRHKSYFKTSNEKKKKTISLFGPSLISGYKVNDRQLPLDKLEEDLQKINIPLLSTEPTLDT